jgi:hypothetical protein
LSALQLFFPFGFFRSIALRALKAVIRLTGHERLLSFAIVSKINGLRSRADRASFSNVAASSEPLFLRPPLGGIGLALSKPHFPGRHSRRIFLFGPPIATI